MENVPGESGPETRNYVFLGCRAEYEACGLVFAQCRPEGSDGERLVAWQNPLWATPVPS